MRKIERERLQSVKMNAAESGGLARRIELESSIGSDRPDLMQIVGADVRRLIQERCADDDLVPIFATDVVRETWLFSSDEATEFGAGPVARTSAIVEMTEKALQMIQSNGAIYSR